MHTAAIETAKFLSSQMAHPRAFVVGEVGLIEALSHEGVIITSDSPDYVVIGEKKDYSKHEIDKAINILVRNHCKLIG